MVIDVEKRFADLEKRVSALEQEIRKKNQKEKPSTSQYKGLMGGINFLIENDFFETLRTKKEVYEELKKEGYYHRPEAVDTALRRDFVGTKKILSRISEEDIWKYGLRK